MCGKLGNYIEDSTEGYDNGVVEEKLSTPGVPTSFFCFSLFALYRPNISMAKVTWCLTFSSMFLQRPISWPGICARWYLNLLMPPLNFALQNFKRSLGSPRILSQ